MTNVHELQLGYVLHARSYRETSLLLEILTADQGRIAVVARGAKRGQDKGRSPSTAVLQPFMPLLLSWVGNGDLVTLTKVELVSVRPQLAAKRIICGLYCNELLVKLLVKWDPCSQLFAAYEQLLQALADSDCSEQAVLRKFEKQLLISIGYGLQLTRDIVTGSEIDATRFYVLDPMLGPRVVPEGHLDAIRGASLLAFAADDYSSAQVMLDLKRMMRAVLAHHLGTQTLMSRQLL